MNMLIVPLYLDALHLDSELTVAASTGDFSRIPYNDGRSDFNYETPFISEAFLSTPFQDDVNVLPPGVHLHWKIPASLTKGESKTKANSNAENTMTFRDVPDRWLVIRTTDEVKREKAWIVESNYLHPLDSSTVTDAITFPLISEDKGQVHRYMGRSYSVEEIGTVRSGNENDYYRHLTAIGYGDPSFASFYPNCHSVFGFHDQEITGKDCPAGLSYEVYGWYSQFQDDPLDVLKKTNAALTAKDILDHFNWNIEDDNIGDRIMCYGKVLKNGFVARKDGKEKRLFSVAVGHNGVEALTAYLNDQDKSYENELAKLLYLRRDEKVQLDETKRIWHAMHERGFSPVSGGSIYAVSINDAGEGATNTQISNNIFSLPASSAKQINEINKLHQAVDRQTDIITAQKQQLFTDWYKYMVSCYHNDLQKELPQPDLIKHLIEEELRANKTQNETNNFEEALQKKKNELITIFDSFNNASTNLSGKIDIKPAFEDITLNNLKVVRFESGGLSSRYTVSANVEAIAAWLYIYKEQPNDYGTLLNINDSFQIDSLTPNKAKVKAFINGVPLHEGVDLCIASLPKDQWFHLYLEPGSFQNPEIVVFNNLRGKLASLRCLVKPITDDNERFCDLNILKFKKITLQKEDAPRYWQPNEPVILIEGDDMKPGGIDSIPKILNCCSNDFQMENTDEVLQIFKTLPFTFTHFTNLASKTSDWNPTLLQWQITIQDQLEFTTTYSQSIDSNYVNKNFKLDKEKGDLVYLKTVSEVQDGTIKSYTGSNRLSDHAKTQVQIMLANYLLTMSDAEIIKINGNEITDEKSQINELREQWKKQNTIPLPTGFYEQLEDAFGFLKGKLPVLNIFPILKERHFLSQTLAGFNAALLQLHQSPQFPVKDPMGFEETTSLTKLVFDELNGQVKNAPLPLNPFNPIRTGAFSINQLAVLDNFGQILKVASTNKASFSRMFAKTNRDDEALLTPRITQPVRLNLRWLSAANEHANEMEMNNDPATTPVCGWMTANNLDHSIMVYDAEGFMIGIIQSVDGSKTQWTATPGNPEIIGLFKTNEAQVKNDYLRQTVNRLLDKDQVQFQSFIELLDETLNQIDPSTFAQHTDLAMLISRPMAVVRCSLNLEVKGSPAINQGWDFFDADLQGGKRTTNEWEHVKFPVFIGEPGMLSDGVLGFWCDPDLNSSLSDGIRDNNLANAEVFKSVHTYSGSDVKVAWYEAKPSGAEPIQVSVGSEHPLTFTMLVDPRGLVHAVSGIVPSKSISIPAHQFKPAVEKMSAVFFSRPLLTPTNKLSLSLPYEPGYEWSWISTINNKSTELFTKGIAKKSDFTRQFPKDGDDIWTELINKQWIAKSINDRAAINPSATWMQPDPNKPLQNHEVEVRAMLDQLHIVPMESNENYSPKMEAKEGWLKLTVTD